MDEVKGFGWTCGFHWKNAKRMEKIYAIPTRFLSIIYHVRSADGRCRKVHKGTCRPHRNHGKRTKVRLMWYSKKMAEELLLDFYNVDSKNWVKEDGSLDETKVSDYLTAD